MTHSLYHMHSVGAVEANAPRGAGVLREAVVLVVPPSNGNARPVAKLLRWNAILTQAVDPIMLPGGGFEWR